MTQITLLLIDNDSDFNTLLKLFFENNHDLKIMTALDKQDGFFIANVHQPDVILLNIAIPNLSELDTYKLLKSHWRTSSIPVILLTAMAGTEDRIKSQIAEDVEIITKPFNMQKLKEQIIKSCDSLRLGKA